MADFYGSARSNYFRVTDLAAFRVEAEAMDMTVTEGRGSEVGKVALLCENTDKGTWPSGRDVDTLTCRECSGPVVADPAGSPGVFCHAADEDSMLDVDHDRDADHVPVPEADVDFEEVDIVDFVAGYLVEGEVAVLMQVGAEKMVYLGGYAIAVDSTGKRVQVSTDDIYDLAKVAFGVAEVGHAER